MRTKLTDGSQTGNLHTAITPWRIFSVDMQASTHEKWYQCAIIDTYSKYVWDDYLAAKDDVYKVHSDFCETEITKLRGERSYCVQNILDERSWRGSFKESETSVLSIWNS